MPSPSKLTAEQIQKTRDMIEQGVAIKEIAAAFGISHAAVLDRCKRYKIRVVLIPEQVLEKYRYCAKMKMSERETAEYLGTTAQSVRSYRYRNKDAIYKESQPEPKQPRMSASPDAIAKALARRGAVAVGKPVYRLRGLSMARKKEHAL